MLCALWTIIDGDVADRELRNALRRFGLAAVVFRFRLIAVSEASPSLPASPSCFANAPTRIPAGKGRERFFVKAGSRCLFPSRSLGRAVPIRPFPFGLAYLAALLERDGVERGGLRRVALNTSAAALLDYAVRSRRRSCSWRPRPDRGARSGAVPRDQTRTGCSLL